MRATPIGPGLPSPAELMFGRPIRTTLPMHADELQSSKHRQWLNKRQEEQKRQYDRYASHRLPDLQPGAQVMVQSHVDHKWRPAVVIERDKEHPRSYMIQTAEGSMLRRNRRFLRDLTQFSSPVQPELAPAPPAETTVPPIPPMQPEPAPAPSTETAVEPTGHTRKGYHTRSGK